MMQDPEKMQGDKKKDQLEEGYGTDKMEVEKLTKITPYLKTIPSAMTKFKNLQTEKNLDSSSTQKLSDAKNSASLEGPFGFGPLVFPSLQRFNNIDFFLFLYFLLVLAHGIAFAMVDLSFKHLEEKFSLSGYERLIMDFGDYYASFMVAIFVAYYGGKGNRSKWLAGAAFMLVIASIIFAAIFYKYEIVAPLEEREELCIEEEDRTMAECGASSIPYRSKFIYLFVLAQFLHGVAGMPLLILGVTFLYDHVPTFSAGLYLAIGDAAQILGYMLGFAIGASGSTHTHEETLDEHENENDFHDLQKNLWSGFFLIAVISFCTFLPLLCFPPMLPGAHKISLEKEKEPRSYDRRLKNKEFGPNLKDLLHALKCLLRNPLLICFSLCKSTESLNFKGTSVFVPKYLENQFLLTPSLATMLTGVIVLPGNAVGRFVGGLIVDRLEMSCKNKIRFVVVTSTVALMLLALILFVECETVEFAGINEDYDGSGQFGNLTAPCNMQCGCSSSIYTSVCGRDDKEYFSPCFAGCKALKYLENEETYYNCSCIKEGLTTVDTEGDFVDAFAGKCNMKCHTLPLFFAFFLSSLIFSNLSSIPVTLIILQNSPANLNSLSLGVTYTIWRISGSIPTPLIFYMSIKESCIYWDVNECGIRRRCWIYNKSKMIYVLMGLCLAFLASSALFGLFGLYKYDSVVMKSTESLVQPVKKVKEKEEKV
ncbi:solute carrier organic anion transporter family member 6A1-like [Onychomys torridus]|uniref:solute carrier organic anion transporter family member 6A1-like n=1 Tax=Onychomys torridus TaxID=38674 RepID=UPI00167F1E07|nr:solute carrier organic anion transporter family member 6A1-like [Onychomys torridus]